MRRTTSPAAIANAESTHRFGLESRRRFENTDAVVAQRPNTADRLDAVGIAR